MMGATKIEWTDAVWNPVTGCTPISAGCANCYAKRMVARLKGRCGYPKRRPFDVTLHHDRLAEPLHWRTPRRVFVCSMGDLFHEDVPDTFIEAVFAHMSFAGQHTFQVLTKRPDRMARWFVRHTLSECQAEVVANPAMYPHRDDFKMRDLRAINGTRKGLGDGDYWPLPNLWLGTTCENQDTYDERKHWLLQCPAAVHFLSLEPLLEGIDLRDDFWESGQRVNWVIAGGETGPGARPAHPDWFRSVRDQCAAAGVKFFFKGWGDWAHISDTCIGHSEKSGKRLHLWPDRVLMGRLGKKLAGRLLDGKEHNAVPDIS